MIFNQIRQGMRTWRLSVSPCVGIVVLWALILVPLCPVVAQTDGASIANSSLRLQFNSQSAAVTSWQVKGMSAHTGEPIRDLAFPARHFFALEGNVKHVPLSQWVKQTGGWSVGRHADGYIEFVLAPAGGGFVLRQSWELDNDNPWRAKFTVQVVNKSDGPLPRELTATIGPGIGEIPVRGLGIAQSIYSYTQLVAGNDHTVYERLPAAGKTLAETSRDVEWRGLESRYFLFAMAGATDSTRGVRWSVNVPEQPRWYRQHPKFEATLNLALPKGKAGSIQKYAWNVYGGGKDYKTLGNAPPDLRATLFSGLWDWMRALTIGLMYILQFIYSFVGSWGVSIILLAVLVRLILHPIARRAMASQKRFVELQKIIRPELVKIKKNYKGGEQSERILQLYKRHKTSPFAGLKPLSIVALQIPIFIALYHLLGQMFELRDVVFLWMDTLAEPDQLFYLGFEIPFLGAYFNLLPALMALSTIASIKLAPAPAADKKDSVRQVVSMAAMTLVFFLLFYTFPAGMVLYWTAANVLQIAHQWVISRKGPDGTIHNAKAT